MKHHITRIKKIHILVSSLIILFFAQDLVIELMSTRPKGSHFFIELFFVTTLIYLIITQIKQIYAIKKELNVANDKLSRLRKDLFSAIDEQFKIWKLSKAETEVAWLVVKGLSFLKISELRDVSEKTIHQQISNVYKKSGTKNRHEFMSGFLEDFINY